MKPHIEALFETMQRFQAEMARAGINKQKIEAAQNKLKAWFKEHGLADSFDWENRE